MIKIIKPGTPGRKTKFIYKKTCKMCRCEFEFEQKDCEIIPPYYDVSIQCPCCHNHLGIDLEHTEKREVEVDEN